MPSFYSHVLNMLLLIVAVFIFINNYTYIMKLEPYKKIVLALLFSITLGMHGISHLGLETNYNYNPLSLFKN
jgi:hypothetical protein